MRDQIQRAVETVPRDRLSEVAGLVWRALSEGAITEIEAESLSLRIEARKAPAKALRDFPAMNPVWENPIPMGVGALSVKTIVTGSRPKPGFRPSSGSRPRTPESMIRRRRWAASGRLPPSLACQFTQGEVAVLSVVSSQVAKTGDCRLTLDHIAAMAGVSRSTVRNAMKHARLVGAVTVEERRLSRWRNAPNIVRIISPAWVSWMRLARRSDGAEGGRNSVTGTCTQDSNTLRKSAGKGLKGHPRKRSGGSQAPSATSASATAFRRAIT